MEFTTRTEDNVRIVKFEDTQILDEMYAQKLGLKLVKTVDSMDETALLLNMQNVQFVASAMIGQLVLLRTKCKKSNVDLRVCEMSDNISEAIKLMRIDQIVTIHETEEAALEALAAEQ